MEREVNAFVKREFPQIMMHDGESEVIDIQPESGIVTLQLGGTCSNCGLAPMTIEAVQRRMTRELNWVTEVRIGIEEQESLDELESPQTTVDNSSNSGSILRDMAGFFFDG